MANKTIEVKAPSGLTLTMQLYPLGSDVIANGAGDSLTERANCKGLYEAIVTEAITGWHDAIIFNGSDPIGAFEVNIVTDDVITYRAYDREVNLQDYGANVTSIDGESLAAQRLAITAKRMIPGTVDDSVFSPTNTQFECSDITEATSDHYKNRLIVFTSGALEAQATTIEAYSLNGGKGRFTVTTLTDVPANGDTFIII